MSQFLIPCCSLPLLLALASPALAQTGPVTTHKPGEQAVGRSSPAITPPDPLAPPGLEDVVGGPVHEARQRLRDAEVFDALGVRALREAQDLIAGLPKKDSCDAAFAALRTVRLAAWEATNRARTALALIDGVGGEDDATWQASIDRRAVDLAAQAAASEDRTLEAGCVTTELAAPRVSLPSEARSPVDDRVVVSVSLPEGHRVLWAQGAPVAVAQVDGWTLALLPVGLVQLCSAQPEDVACTRSVEVEAVMGGAFVLPKT